MPNKPHKPQRKPQSGGSLAGGILKTLLAELRAADKPANRVNYQQFFKEKLENPVGLRTSVLRQISSKVWTLVKPLSKDAILEVCEGLLASHQRYMRFFASEWAGKIAPKCEPTDFARFERWLDQYVASWADCDGLCCGVIGVLVARFPELAAKTKRWARSRNMWRRRAAAVSLVVPARRGMLIQEVLATAEVLLADSEDLVQKGYGWMLKEAGAKSFPEVREFVMAHKDEMPRTALRYAIEKWPAAARKEAMS
ncbi:MAG TPA: DNA alkylation repair protein [bacterium]|nr:DNA alkylation repair protein [bacterium]